MLMTAFLLMNFLLGIFFILDNKYLFGIGFLILGIGTLVQLILNKNKSSQFIINISGFIAVILWIFSYFFNYA